MNPLVDLTVDALAAYRLTRLVTTDHLTEKIRDRIVIDAFTKAGLEVPNEETAGARVASAERLGVPFVPKLARLVTCQWCSSFWVALGLPLVPRWLRRALALSAAAGILSEHYSE